MTTSTEVKPDYGEGYCDGWAQCLERMANLARLAGQANEVYRALWLRWEQELLPWQQDSTSVATPPVFRQGSPVSYAGGSYDDGNVMSQASVKALAPVSIEQDGKVEV